MKFKHLIAVLILGVTLIITGSLFKILHYAGAKNLLITGMFIQMITGLLFIIKLIKTKDFKDFMNK